ncbi:Phenol hydroxylase P5 protein [Corynebacterium kalinowskii]|uniref:Phenol hydroxylase P5 protein n=1 Tax=Corynebacterium kalinowskii TaxID=2675216 RepID=A0A6B8V7U8_9CORY|nr:monooxygenase [Corynebacterium kalinowskii]QGU01182.1 Phenol hydroxylase P5 protein [Corynebacterium kalinowskii]
MPGSVSSVLLAHAPEFRERVLTELYLKQPETRLLFPARAEDAHKHLVFALTYLLDSKPDEDLVANLAREHRAFGLTTELAHAGFDIISRTIHQFCSELPHQQVYEADQHLAWIRDTMIAALEAHIAQQPELSYGTVVDVQRRARRITVIRLECPVPPRYLPGQYFSVSSPLIRGQWQHLAPAIPANDGGFIEFHLSDAPELAGLAVSQPGDQWYFGPPHGSLSISGENDILMVAQGTGLAPLKAMVLEMLATGNSVRTHVYFGAEYPGELYDLAGLWSVAATAPWLAVTPVVEKPADEWWVAGTEHSRPPRGLHLQQVGTLADVVTSWGSWGDRDVLIAGEPEWAFAMRKRMRTAGTPRKNIQVLAL